MCKVLITTEKRSDHHALVWWVLLLLDPDEVTERATMTLKQLFMQQNLM
jgi:hypothetical protein